MTLISQILIKVHPALDHRNESILSRVHTIPGMSDYGIVLVENEARPQHSLQPKHTVSLYVKANYDAMNENLQNFKQVSNAVYTDSASTGD